MFRTITFVICWSLIASATFADVRDQDGNLLPDPFIIEQGDNFDTLDVTANEESEIQLRGGRLRSATLLDSSTFSSDTDGAGMETLRLSGSNTNAFITASGINSIYVEDGYLNFAPVNVEGIFDINVSGGTVDYDGHAFDLSATGGTVNFRRESWLEDGDFRGDFRTTFSEFMFVDRLTLGEQSQAVFDTGFFFEGYFGGIPIVSLEDDAVLDIRKNDFKLFDETMQEVEITSNVLDAGSVGDGFTLAWGDDDGQFFNRQFIIQNISGNGRILLNVPEPASGMVVFFALLAITVQRPRKSI